MILNLLTVIALFKTPPVGQPLPDLRVRVDGVETTIGVVSGDADAFYVNMEDAVPALTKGGATVRGHEGYVSIMVDGGERVRVRTGFGAEPLAVCLDSSNHKVREIELLGNPDKSPDGDHWIDVGSLARLLGDNAQVEGNQLDFFTPEYWAGQLGIDRDRSEGLLRRSIGAGLSVGVTPPSDSVVAWCRPASPIKAQIYSVGTGIVRALAGRNPITGHQVDDPSIELAMPEASSPSEPLRVVTHLVSTSDAGGSEGVFVAVAAASVPGERDPVEAIRDGSLKDFVVVGCRRRYVPSPLTFRLVSGDPKQGLAKIAEENQMSVKLLYEINGLGQEPKLKAGDRLLVLGKELRDVGDKAAPPPGPLVEVASGDTLESLAQRWRVPVQTVLDLNSELCPGQHLEPGTVLTSPKSVGQAEGKIKPLSFTSFVKSSTLLRKKSDSVEGGVPLAKDTPIIIQYSVEPNRYYVVVVATGQAGYVGKNSVAMPDAGEVDDQPSPAPSSRISVPPPVSSYTAWENGVRSTAFRLLGIRYVFGGGSLESGIDCSHYVAAVLERSGLVPRSMVPSPPVIIQETKGRIVHWNVNQFRRYRQGQHWGPDLGPPPSVNRLRPGDRIILQWDPVDDRPGGRHTGIFVGRYGNLRYGVANATRSRGTTITDLFRPYFWKGYRYALRDDFHK